MSSDDEDMFKGLSALNDFQTPTPDNRQSVRDYENEDYFNDN